MRSSWVSDDVMGLVLAAMMPANRLAVQCSLATGLRIDDVLSLHTETVQHTARPYVRDCKTGKLHRVYIPVELREQMLAQAGRVYIWEGRTCRDRHRTRQAVYKDMVRAANIVKRAGWVSRNITISPHSARKCAAVRAYRKGGLAAAAALLQHDTAHPAVTLLYALSDQDQPMQRRPRRRRAS